MRVCRHRFLAAVAVWLGENMQSNHEWEEVDNLGQSPGRSIPHSEAKMI